jgi:hypothetical protein
MTISAIVMTLPGALDFLKFSERSKMWQGNVLRAEKDINSFLLSSFHTKMLIGCSGSLVDSTNDMLALKVGLATLSDFVIFEIFPKERSEWVHVTYIYVRVTEIPNGEISEIN